MIFGTAALGFAFMGAVALGAPERVTRQFGIAQLDRDGRNEVRAVYGGFGVVVTLALAAALVKPVWQMPVGSATALALGGMAAGRLISAAVDRGIGRIPMLYGGIEATAALLLLLAVHA